MQLFPIIDVFVLGSGDTDFIPLIRRVLARGKQVYVIGFEHSVGSVIKDNCTEFKSVEELIGFEDESIEDDGAEKASILTMGINARMGRDLLIRYLKNRPSDEPILLAQLKPLLLRLQPSFSEKQLGFRSFKDFITSMKGDVVKSIESDPRTGHCRVIFYDLDEIHHSICDERSEICGFLTKNLRYQNDPAVRKELAEILYAYLQDHSPATIHEMIDHIVGHTSYELPKVAIRKFVFPLGEDRAFHYASKDYSGSLVDRPQVLNELIHSPGDIERVYVERVRTIMNNKFSDIEDDLLDSLL